MTDQQHQAERTRIYFTGQCEGLIDLREALSDHADLEVIGWSDHVAQAAGVLAGGHLDCIVHGTRSDTFPAGEVAAIREQTRAPIVVVASGSATALLEDALEADVADVLLLPQLVENVVFTIRKAAHAKRSVPAVTRAQLGRVVTVFSPKGGTGKTVTASNLAAALAKQGRKTLLLDLDLQFGDAAIVMGLEPDKTIYDLVVAPGELDIEKLAGYTAKHPCGLDVLPAPLRPEDAELVTESKITRLLEVARECYETIVVDTSPFFHGPMLATLDRTDELLVICGLDVPTLKNVRLALQTLEMLSFPAEPHQVHPQPREHEGRPEQARGRERAQGRRPRGGAVRPRSAGVRQPRHARGHLRSRLRLLEGDDRASRRGSSHRSRRSRRSRRASA